MKNNAKTITTTPGQLGRETDPGCIYIVATLAAHSLTEITAYSDAELRQTLGTALSHGEGDVLVVGDSTAPLNRALAQLQGAHDQVDLENALALTNRETEVLGLVAKGLQSDEVATVLTLSIHTVNTHLRHLFKKLGVHTRTEAVFEAVRLNLLGSSSIRVSDHSMARAAAKLAPIL